MYRFVDAALLRAVAYPTGFGVEPAPAVADDADAERAWITRVWAQPAVAEAIEVASPVLARRLDALCAGRPGTAAQVRRLARSLTRYLLRMQHRCTPFGLFAGIAAARIGDTLTVRWTGNHRLVARVDNRWLHHVITRLETCPELLSRLPVVANNTSFVRGERLVLPCQQPDYGDLRGPAEVSVRHTSAVRTVLAAASSPTTVGDLAAQLGVAYPDTPSATIDAMLSEMVARRFLITALRAPMTVTNPLDHLIDQLVGACAATLDAVTPTLRTLQRINGDLARHTTAAGEERRAVRASVTRTMKGLSGSVEQPLTVDLRLDCELTLPHHVAREAAGAADALARMAPFLFGPPAWQDYHVRFLEHFGPGAVISVQRLIDPDTGLGLPAGYRGSLVARRAPALTERDERLLALAQRAAMDDADEVVLTDTLLTDLAPHPVATPAPHVDLRFHILARTQQALRHGDFTLVVNGVAPAAGATAGRFLDLLDRADQDRMLDTYAGMPTLEPGALRAQVSSPPLDVGTENVARAPRGRSQLISLAEHHHGAAVPLTDLAVTADATRFRLIQLSTGRVVEPTVLNSVELSTFTHPVARLLCELPRARACAFGPFAWGAADRLPYLPRVRYGRAVLATASWRLTARELPGPGAPMARWAHAFARWRQRARVPDAVYVGDDDRRLRLELDHNAHAALLRADLDRSGHTTLREAPDHAAYGWLDNRPHEITIALASTQTQRPTPPHISAVTVDADHGQPPGASRWAYLKLYGHPDRASDILTQHIPRLLHSLDTTLPWWFLRYRDPHDHLRLRFHLPHSTMFGDLAANVGLWATDLRRHGLLGDIQWDTYHPETGRYGRAAAMSAAETVFAADSAAALAEIALIAENSAHPHAVAAAGLVDLTMSFLGDTHTAMGWLTDHHTGPTAHPTRPVYQEAMRLADPDLRFAALHDRPGGNRLRNTWAARTLVLRDYRAALPITGPTAPASVLPALLHTHHLRAIGIDTHAESICLRLARSVARSWIARHEGTTE